MKKLLFLGVFFLGTTMSFANGIKYNMYAAVDNGDVVSLENPLDAFTTEDNIDDICYASCYAEISYEGVYTTTVRSSATAGDCVTAQINCVQDVKRKADLFMSEAQLPQ